MALSNIVPKAYARFGGWPLLLGRATRMWAGLAQQAEVKAGI